MNNQLKPCRNHHCECAVGACTHPGFVDARGTEPPKDRPTKDEYFMEIAHVVAKRATCARRKVGCVVVDGKGYILSTGYNGLPTGFPHCIDQPCEGAHCASGTGLELCQSLHAEQNAIARLREPFEAETLYCTTAPCTSCVKLILATSIRRVVFSADYPTSGKELWLRAGKIWDQV